jgi:hypothetical protein
MKKIFLLLVLLSSHFAFAIDKSLENPISVDQFSQLDQIEAELNKSNADYETLLLAKPELMEGILLNNSTNLVSLKGDDLPLGIPALVWGFCCTVPGLALVYFQTDNDKEQVQKAAIGCVVGSIVWFGGWYLFARSSYYY